MKIGYAIDAFQSLDSDSASAGDDVVSGAQAAYDSDFDYVECPDHHISDDRHFFQHLPTASRLSATFDHVAVMCLLPLYDPVYLAERLGTLDCFVDQLDLWCAIGGHEPAFDAFDVSFENRAELFDEHLSVIESLTADDEPVFFDGEHVSLDGVLINPRPDLRVCIGGIAKPAVRRAGRRGDAWVVSVQETDDDLERKLEWFNDAGGGDVVLRRDALIRDDATTAAADVESLIQNGYRGWDDPAGRILSGDPATVADRLEQYESLGVDDVVISPVDDAGETVDRFRDVRKYLG
ncbi:LLM class flavin-dependent oxidoreductase [Natrialba sp. INN-245]|uniref:LLM class flavin-dependent oxidoreductase n=1 Tax=Natrialba sp. INN-245 TaxID=2690967 RepID=UPI0013128A5B|nr:LLM class flavin-dependent oxidoreductase [Natrialba sp. INN-245]MWV38478.1 LLM class flavin-dependent oxidoreductase [Natrialba sp. INN-245]